MSLALSYLYKQPLQYCIAKPLSFRLRYCSVSSYLSLAKLENYYITHSELSAVVPVNGGKRIHFISLHCPRTLPPFLITKSTFFSLTNFFDQIFNQLFPYILWYCFFLFPFTSLIQCFFTGISNLR